MSVAMGRRKRILLWMLGGVAVLGGALGWLVHNWGQPLPVVYRRLEVVPADAESGRSITYQRLGAPEAIELYISPGGHEFNDEMRSRAYNWIDRWL